jgi:transposase
VRLPKTLVDERTAWQQGIEAQLFHHGVPKASGLLAPARRAQLARLELPDLARTVIATALAMIDHINEQLPPLEAELRSFGRRQRGCRGLAGPLRHRQAHERRDPGQARRRPPLLLLSPCGAPRRLDVTVAQPDEARAPGKLSPRGAPLLRWAAFEAAQRACREGSPDHRYFLETRLGAAASRRR